MPIRAERGHQAIPLRACQYDELRLRLTPGNDGGHRVLASTGSAEVAGHFEPQLSELDIDNLLMRAPSMLRGCRGAPSPSLTDAKRIGGLLFDALFGDRISGLYREALAMARAAGKGLRITLCLSEAPQLVRVPWEYLFDAPHFLAVSAYTPVVRYLDLPQGPRPLAIEPPLRILGVVSSPADYPRLDVDGERSRLEGALSELVRAGAVSLDWLEQPTLSELLRMFQRGTFHALHYVGHGKFDEESQTGFLLLEDPSGWSREVSGDQLATILRDFTSLRLAVLNACDGARTGVSDPFAGAAQSLVQREIPAVIAMQSEITDDAATVFAQGFYSAIATGVPVDAALAAARLAMFAERSDDVEWGAPALFMRVPDGRILDFASASEAGDDQHNDPGTGGPRPAPAQTLTGVGSVRSALRGGQLPGVAHALVGRRAEVACVEGLLSRDDVRLISLLGPGGVGKTMLAIEVAARLRARYRDGVWFVPLAPLTDPALVAPEIARTLGIKETAGESLMVTVGNAIADRELLLVLDNFEHVIAAEGLVSELLESAPHLDVLVTSRHALNLRGEHRIVVPPLPPEDAAKLLVDRAVAVRRDVATGGPEHEAVQRLCERLEGLPLALELAAAHVALFSFSALETRLTQRLDLPAGARDRPHRQRTLRGTLDWSYQLLSAPERRLYRGLACFAGGARLEAVESIFDDLGADVTETIAALVDKSLLRRGDDPDGLPRFWMLETIREHACECAASDGDADAMAARHARYFLQFARDGERELVRPEQSAWLARLQAEHDNLRVSLDYLAAYCPSQALLMVGALARFWELHGHLAEAQQRVGRVLSLTRAEGAAGAKAINLSGRLAYLEGDIEAAEPLFLEAVRAARVAREFRVEVSALSHLGRVARARGDLTRALELHEDALAVARVADDDWTLMVAVGNLGAVLADTGQLDRGVPLVREALELSCGLGETMAAALWGSNLAELALAAGGLEELEWLIPESLRRARELESSPMTGWVLSLQALWNLRRGEEAAARASLTEALACMDGAYDAELSQVVLAITATHATAWRDHVLALQLWAALDRQMRTQHVPQALLVERLREEWLPKAEASLDVTMRAHAWSAGADLLPDEALRLAARPAVAFA
jgi:predicted ATPase